MNKQIRHIWAVLIQHFEQKCNVHWISLNFAQTLLPSSGQNLNCSWAGRNTLWPFILGEHLKKGADTHYDCHVKLLGKLFQIHL